MSYESIDFVQPEKLSTLGHINQAYIDKLNRELDRARSKVFLGKDSAFFSSIMCSLDFQWDYDSSLVQTAATDGEKFWWAIEDFDKCTPEERESTIMHELWHVARLHKYRQGTRDQHIWNLACDTLINRHLAQDGFTVGADWHQRPDITLESEEEIYDFLVAEGLANNSRCGSRCAHQALPDNPSSKPKTMNTVVQALQAASLAGEFGGIPGDVRFLVDQFLRSVVPWEQVLHNFFNDISEEKSTWKRPNRRYQNMYMPTKDADSGRLQSMFYFIDVSGSISDLDIVRFNSELRHIKEQFKPKKITIIQFDTVIQKIDVIDDFDEFEKIEIEGRGGTSLTCVRDYIIEHAPDAVVIFSDLYCNQMEPIDVPVIWAVIENPSAQVLFGTMIHITEKLS